MLSDEVDRELAHARTVVQSSLCIWVFRALPRLKSLHESFAVHPEHRVILREVLLNLFHVTNALKLWCLITDIHRLFLA